MEKKSAMTLMNVENDLTIVKGEMVFAQTEKEHLVAHVILDMMEMVITVSITTNAKQEIIFVQD